METSASEITRLLRAWSEGDRAAFERLATIIYPELQSLARRQIHRRAPGETLQTTALVNEAFLHLMDASRATWHDRAHFFGFCAQTMRRILIDAARARSAGKRGGRAVVMSLDESIDAAVPRDRELLALDDALNELARQDPRAASVVEMRFFGGLSVDQTAATLKLSPRTVEREWDVARVWLMREIAR